MAAASVGFGEQRNVMRTERVRVSESEKKGAASVTHNGQFVATLAAAQSTHFEHSRPHHEESERKASKPTSERH